MQVNTRELKLDRRKEKCLELRGLNLSFLMIPNAVRLKILLHFFYHVRTLMFGNDPAAASNR